MKNLLLPLILCALLGKAQATGQVLIHEVMASNGSAFADEDGGFEDWIELHNAGTTAVDLHGYGLTDNLTNPFKWAFGPQRIEAGAYLVVWASGKNRQAGVAQPGLRREVYAGIGGSDLSSLLGNPSFPSQPSESGFLSGFFEAPTNVGDNYGQRISGQLVAPATGNYRFWIASDDQGRLSLSPDENPFNAVAIASVPQWTGSREWFKYAQQQSAEIHLQAGRRYHVEALMKEGGGGDNLAVRWRKPDGTIEGPIPANHFLAGISQAHTSFSIGANGEALQLTRPDGTVADSVPAVALPRDVSFGRAAGDPQTWRYFSQSTPGGPNSTDGFREIVWETPQYSADSGFHPANFALQLQAADPDATILYTLDGSVPDPANLGGKTYSYKNQFRTNVGDPIGPMLTGSFRTLTYAAPINIRNRTSHPNHLSIRNTTFNTSASGFAPTTPVFKGTVVRSRLVKEGAMPGPVVTRSYFVTPEAAARYRLPVLSLAMDEDALFGYSTGNYTAGEDFERWRANNGGGPNGGTPANYTRRGEYSERPLHLEAFTPGQTGSFSQNLGFRMHGGWSRAAPQKSLRLYAKGSYDDASRMDHPFIPGLVGNATGAPIDSFRRLALRNSGNDNARTRILDAFIQRLVKPLGVDQQGYQPAVHFINGEYWGLINIRERVDRFFISSHHGIDPDNIAILSNNALIAEGTQSEREEFLNLRNYIAANSMADPARYAVAEARMDMHNFILYNVAQIYANNRDWPHNNIDYWRSIIPGPGPTNDARWRWVLYDTDFGFGANGDHNTNTLSHATNTTNDWSKVMLRKLLENPTFRRNFINAFADHMAVTFRPARVAAMADEMAAVIAPHMGEHALRWRNQGSGSVSFIKTFGQGRPAAMRQHLINHFRLAGDASVTLNVAGSKGGHFTINTITINSDTEGLPNPSAPFPWTGNYFRGVPVTVTATPNPGHRFVRWLQYPASQPATLTVDPGTGVQLTAVFEQIPANELPQLVHHWDFESGDVGPPTQSAGGGSLQIQPAPNTSASIDDPSADFETRHLRVNSPLEATMELSLPTINFENITLEFLTLRSATGAGIQNVSYTIDGSNWTPFESYAVTDTTPQRIHLDFSEIPDAGDNLKFAVRVTFEQGTGGDAGNHRFDEISVSGTLVAEPNFPPRITARSIPADMAVVQAGGPAIRFDISGMFSDPEEDVLTLSASSDQGQIARAELSAGTLVVSGLNAGDSTVTLGADDGTNVPVTASFRVLVHPAAHVLAGTDYIFNQWAADSPALTYPAHMIFLQSEQDDPSLETPLERAYAIPAADAAAPEDADFPYAATARSRINGLGDSGISFIATGRGRDPGGALLALDTRGVFDATVAFTAGTLTPNPRLYGLRLQYRIGASGPFLDVTEGTSAPAEYLASTTAGDALDFGPITLPQQALGHEYVQLLWRYHHISGDTGARPEIRLDNIIVSRITGDFARWRELQFPDADDFADPNISGPQADPHGSGVTNLMRYALGIGAAESLPSRMPALVATPAGPPAFRFPYDPTKTDIAYVVEASSDLIDWSEILFDSRENPAPTQPDGWLEISNPPAATTNAARFLRLKVLMRNE